MSIAKPFLYITKIAILPLVIAVTLGPLAFINFELNPEKIKYQELIDAQKNLVSIALPTTIAASQISPSQRDEGYLENVNQILRAIDKFVVVVANRNDKVITSNIETNDYLARVNSGIKFRARKLNETNLTKLTVEGTRDVDGRATTLAYIYLWNKPFGKESWIFWFLNIWTLIFFFLTFPGFIFFELFNEKSKLIKENNKLYISERTRLEAIINNLESQRHSLSNKLIELKEERQKNEGMIDNLSEQLEFENSRLKQLETNFSSSSEIQQKQEEIEALQRSLEEAKVRENNLNNNIDDRQNRLYSLAKEKQEIEKTNLNLDNELQQRQGAINYLEGRIDELTNEKDEFKNHTRILLDEMKNQKTEYEDMMSQLKVRIRNGSKIEHVEINSSENAFEESSANSIINGLANITGCLFTGAKIPTKKGGDIQIDHILFCEKGIFVIECKSYTGLVSGGLNTTPWKSTKAGKTTEIKASRGNPSDQTREQVFALKDFLSNNKIDDETHIHGLVLFPSSTELKLEHMEVNAFNGNAIVGFNQNRLAEAIKKLKMVKNENSICINRDKQERFEKCL